MMRRSKGQSQRVEEEDAYFTYRPLSNLPTPPPTSRNLPVETCPVDALIGADSLNHKFLGPAIHLANLVPASASPLATPSVPLVQALLTRCDLPIDSIALSVCILDSLDSKKFARRWRSSCPLITDAADTSLAQPTSPSYLPPSPSASPPATPAPSHTRHHSRTASQTHIDSVQPEVIILAALVIANKFLEDPQDRADYYCRAWAGDMWSCPQLNATERCLMEELDYRIMPLCDPDLLEDAKADMHFAAVYHSEDNSSFSRSSLLAEDSWAGAHSGACSNGWNGWDVPRDMSPSDLSAGQQQQAGVSGPVAVGLGLQMTIELDDAQLDEDEDEESVPCAV